MLVTHGVLVDRDEDVDRIRRFINDTLASIDRPADRRLIQAYATWRVLRRLRRRAEATPGPRTATNHARTSIKAAVRLLDWLDERGTALTDATQADIDAWLVTGPGASYARDFVLWVVETSRCPRLTIPPTRAGTGTPTDPDDRWRLLARLLHDDKLDLTDRVAGCLVLLYAQPLSRITIITRDRIDRRPDGTLTLRFGTDPVTIPQPLAGLITELAAPDDATSVSAHPPPAPGSSPASNPDSPSPPPASAPDSPSSESTAAAQPSPTSVGLDGLPDGLERLTTLSGADELREVLAQPHSNGKTNLPRTVILAAGLPSEVSVLLRTTSELRGDLVAVVSGLQPRSGNWSVHIEGSGRARLAPEDVAFDLLDLGDEVAPLTAKLIEQALHDPEQLVQLPDDEPGTIHLDEPTATPDTVEDAGDGEDEPTTEVRVLGPVEIVGTVGPFRTNKTIELIVYLALHRSGASADTILEALWPDQEPRPARLYTEASRARKSLGSAPDGTPHFPDAELGRYRLADSVALDYERYTAAVAAARRDPNNATHHLRRALQLVRGVPLSATATECAWATNELYALAQEVVDAAHDLAQLCLAAERYDDAIWAAERGLLADPLAEVLVRDLMEAAAATGNTIRVLP